MGFNAPLTSIDRPACISVILHVNLQKVDSEIKDNS
jgi:hypothetical protein